MRFSLIAMPIFIFGFTFFPNCAGSVSADVRLASQFGDNMVLQRDVDLPVWGWTDPGDDVAVFARDQAITTKADQNGKWMVHLQPMAIGEPFSIRVKGSRNEVEIENVVMGEVWICSGQSNMEWTVDRAANSLEERNAANFPMIRHMKVLHNVSTVPLDECKTTGWQVCSPATVGDFTAVGYFFGRKLHQELNVPIGLINTSWGGTIVEAWTSAESLHTHPDFAKRIDDIRARNNDAKLETARRQFELEVKQWHERYDAAVKKSDHLAESGLDDTNWKHLSAPGPWEEQGFPQFDGIAWYRKTVDLPESWVGQELALSLGPIDDSDRTFVNGQNIGKTNGWNTERKYKVPSNLNSQSKLTIAVQVNDTGGAGGFHGESNLMSIGVDGRETISLAGKWRFKTNNALSNLSPKPNAPGFNGPNHPTALYNAMVQPLIPFAFKGTIWYQGEANASRGIQYRSLFPLLINDWRQKWNRELPFYWVQLANFRAAVDRPGPSDWAELREAQSMTLKIPKTGEAVIIDIGAANDIHPKNKQDVGKRLAWIALKQDYGFEIDFSGPRYRKMKIEGNQVRLIFDHSQGLKSSNVQPLSQFAIAGEDQKFVWATAVIDGSDVVVSSSEIANPVAVRYAWANNPVGCNLSNRIELPASPFRTDDWPVTSSPQN